MTAAQPPHATDRTGSYGPPPESVAEKELIQALHAFIRDSGTPKPPPPDEDVPGHRTFVVLSVLAIDISAVVVLLGDHWHNPLVNLTVTLFPILVGTGLVTYFNQVRRWLVRASKGAWLPSIAALGLVAVALVVVPYTLLLQLPDGSQISLDGSRFFRATRVDSMSRIFVRGLSDHVLEVRSSYPANGKLMEKTDSVHFGRLELLRGLYSTEPFVLSIRPTVSIARPLDATTLVVTGALPRLFLSEARFARWGVRKLPAGRSEIEIPIEDDVGSSDVDLPEGGPWTLRVRRRGGLGKTRCAKPVMVSPDSLSHVDLGGC